MSVVMWWVQEPVCGAATRDVLSSDEDGAVIRWERTAGAWVEHAPVCVGLPALAAWWAAGVIAPASPEDGDRLRVHQLLASVATPAHPWQTPDAGQSTAA